MEENQNGAEIVLLQWSRARLSAERSPSPGLLATWRLCRLQWSRARLSAERKAWFSV